MLIILIDFYHVIKNMPITNVLISSNMQ